VIGMGDRAYYETVVLDLGLMPADLHEQLLAERPPLWAEWKAFARRAIERHHRPDEGISLGLGPSGPQRCTDEMLAGCAALADELDLPIHIHVLETRMQALSSRQLYGCTLPAHMKEIGFLSPRVNFEHGIWLTNDDIALVADAGVTVVHNPVSNLKLGSGISPVPQLLHAGIPVALGTDGMSSNDGNDMYATLKIAGLLHKLWETDYEQWLGAREAWQMATGGGARAAGEADILGRIEPGRRADLVLLDLESRIFTPLNDPLNHIVFSATTNAVRSVLVGGRWTLRDGKLTGLDEDAVLAEARELGAEVLSRHDTAFELGQQLLEPLRHGWLQALAADVGARRSMPV
jgi:cytosine/adenosine deaminase-related metal-dependent hydrolase